MKIQLKSKFYWAYIVFYVNIILFPNPKRFPWRVKGGVRLLFRGQGAGALYTILGANTHPWNGWNNNSSDFVGL